jgi:pantothenate kinase type III
VSGLLAINIGNSETRVWIGPEAAWSAPTLPVEEHRGRLAAFADLPSRWLGASVVPKVNAAWEALARERGASFAWVGPGLLRNVDCSAVDMSTVGADRIVNIAAAALRLQLPALVLDCGTAITTELVVPGPRFLGGAILPGRQMSRKALAAFTGLLPQTEMVGIRPPATGTNTRAAISAGVDVGLVGAVEELVAATIRENGLGACQVVATGGDASYFSDNLAAVRPAPAGFAYAGFEMLAGGLNAVS